MEYSELAEIYEKLESTPSKHGKRDILAELFKSTDEETLEKIVLLVTGKVFPTVSDEDLGIANSMIKKALAKATGHTEKKVTEMFRDTGDLGLVSEELVKRKRQSTLMKKKLSVDQVFDRLKKLASTTGTGSQERKLNLISELISAATPKEAKYITRTALGTLRIGVAEGTVRDAISKAFNVDKNNVEHAWNMNPDYSEIVKIAKNEGDEGLEKVGIDVGTSVQVLLAEKAADLKSAIDKFEEPIIEIKYDGARVQIHKDGNIIRIFTRRLEDVTKQFPDIVDLVKRGIKSDVKTCVLDGEMVAINKDTKRPLAFQRLSQRIQRKHDIEKMVEEIPVQVNLFDVLYVNGESMLDMPLRKRREMLEEIIKKVGNNLILSEKLVTKDYEKAREFYEEALKKGHEGVMVKNPDSEYQPGKRVGYWLKVKPIMEPLDLVIVGADWGTGKRANWLSSFTLACRDPNKGEFLPCGMMGTGLSDEEFKDMTVKLKPLIREERGRHVEIEPKIIIEVSYEEIQKSTKYKSGYALRFPRMKRERTSDKSLEDVDTVKRVKRLYKSQKKGRSEKQ